jgi:hypothetical protein
MELAGPIIALGQLQDRLRGHRDDECRIQRLFRGGCHIAMIWEMDISVVFEKGDGWVYEAPSVRSMLRLLARCPTMRATRGSWTWRH